MTLLPEKGNMKKSDKYRTVYTQFVKRQRIQMESVIHPGSRFILGQFHN